MNKLKMSKKMKWVVGVAAGSLLLVPTVAGIAIGANSATKTAVKVNQADKVATKAVSNTQSTAKAAPVNTDTTSSTSSAPLSTDAQFANAIAQAVLQKVSINVPQTQTVNGQTTTSNVKMPLVLTSSQANYQAIANTVTSLEGNSAQWSYNNNGSKFSAQLDTLVQMSLSSFMGWRPVNNPVLNGTPVDMSQVQFGLNQDSYAAAQANKPIPVVVNYNTIPGSNSVIYIGYGQPTFNQTVTVISPMTIAQANSSAANKKAAWNEVWQALQKKVGSQTSMPGTDGINYPFNFNDLVNPGTLTNVPNINASTATTGAPNSVGYNKIANFGTVNVQWISYQDIVNQIEVQFQEAVTVVSQTLNVWQAQQVQNQPTSGPQIMAAIYKKLGWTPGATNSLTIDGVTVQIPAWALGLTWGKAPAMPTAQNPAQNPFNITLTISQVLGSPVANPAVAATAPVQVTWIHDFNLIPNIGEIWVYYLQYQLQQLLGSNYQSAATYILNDLIANKQVAANTTVDQLTTADVNKWLAQDFMSYYVNSVSTNSTNAYTYVQNIWWPQNVTPYYPALSGTGTEIQNYNNSAVFNSTIFDNFINPAFKVFGQNQNGIDPTSITSTLSNGQITFNIQLTNASVQYFQNVAPNSNPYVYNQVYKTPNGLTGSTVNANGWNSAPTATTQNNNATAVVLNNKLSFLK